MGSAVDSDAEIDNDDVIDSAEADSAVIRSGVGGSAMIRYATVGRLADGHGDRSAGPGDHGEGLGIRGEGGRGCGGIGGWCDRNGDRGREHGGEGRGHSGGRCGHSGGGGQGGGARGWGGGGSWNGGGGLGGTAGPVMARPFGLSSDRVGAPPSRRRLAMGSSVRHRATLEQAQRRLGIQPDGVDVPVHIGRRGLPTTLWWHLADVPCVSRQRTSTGKASRP